MAALLRLPAKRTAKADTERMAVTMGKEYVIEKTKELMNAASCCAEAKAAAQAWLDAIGTDGEAAAAKAYVAELEADIMPVDGLIAFAKSETGAQVFGAEMAKNVAAHGEEIKAAGGKYCSRGHPGADRPALSLAADRRRCCFLSSCITVGTTAGTYRRIRALPGGE